MHHSKNEVRKIIVVSNTHWDREFRRSFEKTRHALIRMMDTTIGILENDPDYASFTMDGHTIMIEDYLDMKPEMRPRIEKLVKEGRLVLGPYYTLAEEFSIGHEALVRNLIWGRKTTEKYGGKTGTVAYTPSSWGQTGQLPQIFLDFGLDKMMFYRGMSHHETKAEFIWQAPDGSQVYASRFAIYARYNWYYQVHRMVTRGTVFDKSYHWARYNESPLRIADGYGGDSPSFDLKDPQATYRKDLLKQAIEDMLEREASHYTTPVFLAMHGHDISAAHPQESQIIKDAKEIFKGEYEIEHGNLEDFWREAQKYLDTDNMTHLTGERRSYLKEGMWTFLFPATISARTYMKQHDFNAYTALVYTAEPLAAMAGHFGLQSLEKYRQLGWTYLLSNHTHDANGGCAPDAVNLDMEYRYRKVNDISSILSEEAMAHITRNLAQGNMPGDAMQLVVFNPLPLKRDEVVVVDVEVPVEWKARAIELVDPEGEAQVEYQAITDDKSSVFMDSIWEVPTILSTNQIRFNAKINGIPALGYKTFVLKPLPHERRDNESLVTGPASMENEYLTLEVNPNGSLNILNKTTGREYKNLNYLLDQGEAGTSWEHHDLPFDEKINSLGVNAKISIAEEGPLSSTLCASYDFRVPAEYVDGTSRSGCMASIPVTMYYTLEKDAPAVKVKARLVNNAKDHWLRACFPSCLETDKSWADSHFDVVSRAIQLPDSTGWVEEARGTHPLRTFVSLHDESNGLSIIPKGLFEYEVLRDRANTIALTLIRACRIKLRVSEEKVTELPDEGIQCPGEQRFEYMIYPHAGDWKAGDAIHTAATFHTPVRLVQSSVGKGSFPLQHSLIESVNPAIHISAVKHAESGEGMVIRMFNPGLDGEPAHIILGERFSRIVDCGMAEDKDQLLAEHTHTLNFNLPAKKIKTIRLEK